MRHKRHAKWKLPCNDRPNRHDAYALNDRSMRHYASYMRHGREEAFSPQRRKERRERRETNHREKETEETLTTNYTKTEKEAEPQPRMNTD